MDPLYQFSFRILLDNQSPEGAYIACPEFNTYRYAWFRDGSFCAYAAQKAGYPESAFRFHQWASRVVLRYQAKLENCIRIKQSAQMLDPKDCFHSRFTLTGEEVPGHWGFHQLDGLGTWLWAVGEYRRSQSTDLPEVIQQASRLVYRYLAALWDTACSDCWEENETELHTYTLAAIYGGVKSFADLFLDSAAEKKAVEIRRFILANCVKGGTFVKSVGDNAVDANLMGLYLPYHVVEWTDPIFQKTLQRIQQELATPGVHRYRKDTYYGGGEWVLLTEWLGWLYANAGEILKALEIQNWAMNQVDIKGGLPEQVPHALFAPNLFMEWQKRWGAVASPLLWSHAMYIILVRTIEETQR